MHPRCRLIRGATLLCSQVIDKMVLAADERRHNGVIAYLGEVLSYSQLYADCLAAFEQGQADGSIDVLQRAPCSRWFEMQFWPANEHVRAAFQYTGRFPLKMQLQIRNLRKHHPHVHYCSKQRKNAKAWAHKFADYVLILGADDKATGNIGEPGTAVSILSKQRKTVGALHGNQIAALDHEAGHVKVKMVPTVIVHHNKPTGPESSWYNGQTTVILKNNIFEGSNAFGAMAEILLNYSDGLAEEPIFLLHTDGGGEHNLSFPSVQAAAAAFVLKARPDHAVFTNSAPYHSFLNEPERVMSILNLALYGVALERPKIDNEKYRGEEARFKSTKTISDLRTQAERFPDLKDGLHGALEPVFELLYSRFEKLSLGGVPFKRGEHVSSEAVDELFDTVRQLLAADASDITRTDLKRKHLNADCKFKRFWETHFIVDRYKVEYDKSCWRGQLSVLKAQNGGTLPQDKVEELYSSFECEFGCPRPRMPADKFLAMSPVPRPLLPPGVTGKYLSFDESFGKDTPYCAPALGNDSAKELAPAGTTVGDNLRSSIRCSACPRVRGVYTKAKIDSMNCNGRTGKQVLVDFLETARRTYVCGDDLGETVDGDTTMLVDCPELKGTARPYVRLKLCCSTPCETQLYTASNRPLSDEELKQLCSICGESGSAMKELDGDCLTDGAYLPTCNLCYTQLGALRGSGRRQSVRYDRSGQRAVRPDCQLSRLSRTDTNCRALQDQAAAAATRQAQVDRATSSSSATSTSTTTSASTTTTTATTTAATATAAAAATTTAVPAMGLQQQADQAAAAALARQAAALALPPDLQNFPFPAALIAQLAAAAPAAAAAAAAAALPPPAATAAAPPQHPSPAGALRLAAQQQDGRRRLRRNRGATEDDDDDDDDDDDGLLAPPPPPERAPLPEPADGDTPMSEQEAEAGEEAGEAAPPPRADGRARRATAGHATHDSQEGYG